MTHLATSKHTVSLPHPKPSKDPQSPLSLVQFKKLGKEDGVSGSRRRLQKQPYQPLACLCLMCCRKPPASNLFLRRGWLC